MDIPAALVKELRALTGAGVLDCRNALAESGGDLQKAVELLRAKGLATAQKKANRETREGLIEAYIHQGGRLGVLVEVNCETDFVSRTEDFKRLAHDLAMHIAASAPRYISREEIPPEVEEEQRRIFRLEARGDEAVAEAMWERWVEENCLLEQPFIRDESRKVQEVIAEAVAKVGENIVVRRFVRFKLGEP
ncbi:MAG: translation elongation factor Ts [Armatimonadota bacterium]|nr:translation elongation factor Ts [Armatimonadota bacterium]MDR5704018.1 translation elongation factor Ts [Armatimonadota bacterium]MDR7433683.1 translation elongation factor Ts [Armatimonadota bacterium]